MLKDLCLYLTLVISQKSGFSATKQWIHFDHFTRLYFTNVIFCVSN